MRASDGFHDLLFEMSNENRYWILLILKEQSRRITDLTQVMKLTTTEVRRHVSRLVEANLIQRDIEGYYHLTPYGDASLLLFQEFEFLSAHSDYFKTHTLSSIPTRFIKRIGELSENVNLTNPMDFFRHTENLLKESKEYVYFLVDQFPMNSLSSIVEAIERGIKIRIIEPRDRILNPDLDVMTSEETQALSRTRRTPLVEQRMVGKVNVFLFVSDSRCLLAFPTIDGEFDYKGFTSTDNLAHQWCADLFQYRWQKAEERITTPVRQVERGRVLRETRPSERVVVVGQENPEIDPQAVQDAVDHYNEVILKGTFNFGVSSVLISKSVIIKGEGRENAIPTTTIYKKGWIFPFREWDYVFNIEGNGADVTIENIFFTDFNCVCIQGLQGNSLNIKNNRITLDTGFGRGVTYAALGDWVFGIYIQAIEDSFREGVTIEGNYIDFSYQSMLWGGHLLRGGYVEDSEYRPDLLNHEYFVSVGITVLNLPGIVRIENNIVRNANARGIAASHNQASADVRINNNNVTSEVYGSYLFSSPDAGAGIVAQSAFTPSTKGPSFYVEIEDNQIELNKLNYSGILILGPSTDRKGVDKLRGGFVRNNSIKLKDGYEGIHIRKCDEFEVSGNNISGKSYYGIRISGRRKPGEQDLRAFKNLVYDNDMSNLKIKRPDKYSNKHADGRRFASSRTGSATSHIWLDKYSEKNVIKISKNEKLIDEGEANTIEYN